MSQPESNLPKNQSTIRAALNAIRDHAEVEHQTGPNPTGMHPDKPVQVAVFDDREAVHKFQKLLNRERIDCEQKIGNKSWHFYVQAKDSKKATELYLSHRDQLKSKGIKKAWRHDYLIFGLIIGASLCALLIYGVASTGVPANRIVKNPLPFSVDPTVNVIVVMVQICVLKLIFFGASGHVIDRMRNLKAKTNQTNTFGIQELFIFGSMPVLAFLLWNLFFDLHQIVQG